MNVPIIEWKETIQICAFFFQCGQLLGLYGDSLSHVLSLGKCPPVDTVWMASKFPECSTVPIVSICKESEPDPLRSSLVLELSVALFSAKSYAISMYNSGGLVRAKEVKLGIENQ